MNQFLPRTYPRFLQYSRTSLSMSLSCIAVAEVTKRSLDRHILPHNVLAPSQSFAPPPCRVVSESTIRTDPACSFPLIERGLLMQSMLEIGHCSLLQGCNALSSAASDRRTQGRDSSETVDRVFERRVERRVERPDLTHAPLA